MTRGRKILFVIGFALIIAIVAAWGAIYAFADQQMKTTPRNSAVLPTSSPVISISWPQALGAKLLSYEVFIDGEEVSDWVKPAPGGLVCATSELSEGGHVLEAQLTYWWLLRRKVKVRSCFTTDTITPEISFSKSGEIIAVQNSWVNNLGGSTEPGATVEVSLNGKKLSLPDVDETGHFYLNLYGLQDKNELKIVVTDLAGNTNSIKIPLVIDRNAPSIKEYFPKDSETVHSENVSFSALFEEGESRIESSVLRIDDIQVYGNFDTKKNLLTYTSNSLGQGEHKAVLIATDAAGNVMQKNWSFAVDTTRLVLSVSQRKIYFYRGGVLVKTYPCAVGTSGHPTPKGHWKVAGKRKNPAWYNPHSAWSASMPEVIPPGPGNPLGTRAIELNAPAIRIHGTPNPGSVGSAASHGCIRMYRKDVEELFDEVSVGVPVDIVD